MKILQICHRVPFPPFDGGNIAMYNLILSLRNSGAEVYQFALNTRKHYTDPSTLPPVFKNDFHFSSVTIDTSVTLMGILLNFFRRDSYNVIRFYSEDAARKLEEILKKHDFDIVQLETLYSAPYISVIRKYSKAKIVLRAHNVEHLIWKRLSHYEKNPVRSRYFLFLSKRLKKYESSVLHEVDAVVPISSVDEQWFQRTAPSLPNKTISLGLEMDEYLNYPEGKNEMSLFHIGSMDWLPNQEGLVWFIQKCWQQIHREFPNLTLHLAGKNFPENFTIQEGTGLYIDGWVPDSLSYMSARQIMIVPLLSGSGLRVKIIQALAMGRTVISTSIGAEGIEYVDKRDLFIANTPEEFLDTLRICLNDTDRCLEAGRNGKQLVKKLYNNTTLGAELSGFYQKLVN